MGTLTMKMMTLKSLLLVTFTALFVPSAGATEQDNVMKTVRQWVEGLNKGDTKAAIAACASETSIVDEFPPHEWHGEGACARWVSELEVYNRGLGLTDSHVTLGKPRRVDINGDRAYVVAPTEFNFKEHGKAGKEAGALFTVSLKSSPGGWRITGWAWSRP
jgi:ketosteroid isomerase-like protein